MLLNSHVMKDKTSLVWKSLADGTRREILNLLREGPRTTGELCSSFPALSRFAIMKHLRLLQTAGLLRFKREGKKRWNYLNAEPLREIFDEKFWPEELSLQLEHQSKGGKMTETQKLATGVSAIQIEITFNIDAPLARVWNAFVNETNRWWPRDYYANPESKAFFLEPRLGGRMYEDAGNGTGVLWYIVIAIDPSRSIDMSGNLMPAFGGPASSLLRLQFRENSSEATMLHLTDALIGRLAPTAEKEISEGWKTLFGSGLKRFAEGNLGL